MDTFFHLLIYAGEVRKNGEKNELQAWERTCATIARDYPHEF